MTLLLLASALFLLFGGSRVGAAGKGLGVFARHVQRAMREEDDAAPSAPELPMIAIPEHREPKLLPAKGESSACSERTEP